MAISINKGDALIGRAAVTEMAAGFMAEFPDLALTCDDLRYSGTHNTHGSIHALFTWTLTGHHAETKNYVAFSGWEEWELDDDIKVISSLGWFDGDDYDKQVVGGK